MATYYTDKGTIQNGTSISSRTQEKDTCGQILIATATYTVLGTEAANDVVNIVLLPAGAVVFPHLSNLTTNVAATTLTYSVGNTDGTANATQFSSALDIHAAANLALTGGSASLVPYTLTAASWIQGKVTTASTITAGGTIVHRIAYAVV